MSSDVPLSIDLVRRMFDEANDRLADAQRLSEWSGKRSDTHAIVDVLGFEVLLKAALVYGGTKNPWGHEYVELWSQLPADDQTEILAGAKDRMQSGADYSDLGKVLRDLTFVFVKARYGYSLYQSSKEMEKAANDWIKAGMPEEAARVRYRPMELMGLIHGLQKFLDRRIAMSYGEQLPGIP